MRKPPVLSVSRKFNNLFAAMTQVVAAPAFVSVFDSRAFIERVNSVIYAVVRESGGVYMPRGAASAQTVDRDWEEF